MPLKKRDKNLTDMSFKLHPKMRIVTLANQYESRSKNS